VQRGLEVKSEGTRVVIKHDVAKFLGGWEGCRMILRIEVLDLGRLCLFEDWNGRDGVEDYYTRRGGCANRSIVCPDTVGYSARLRLCPAVEPCVASSRLVRSEKTL